MNKELDKETLAETLQKIDTSLKSISENLAKSLRPFVIFDIRPSKINTQFLEIVIKNSGKSPAYDVKMKFEPDLDYFGETTLSKLPIFNRLPFIEQGLEITIPYKTFFEVLGKEESTKNQKSIVKVTYYDCPVGFRKQDSRFYEETFEVDITLYQGQIAREESQIKDIVKELRSVQMLLRGGLLIKTPQDIQREFQKYTRKLQGPKKSK